MAATACAYGYRTPMPSSAAQVMGSFDDDGRGHHRSSIIDGVVMPPPPAPPPPPPPLPPPIRHRHPGLCTEGLGSESSESSGDLDLGGLGDDDIEDKEAGANTLHCKRQQHFDNQEEAPMPARTRGSKRVFPPPISVIGAAGKPWQYLMAQRGGGRLVLREVRIPSRELLHACREDGRLKLHFAHPEEQHFADDQETNN